MVCREGFPIGVLPDAIEIGLQSLLRGDEWAFGLMLHGPHVDGCRTILKSLLQGLDAVGRPPRRPSDDRPRQTRTDDGVNRSLHGCFEVSAVHSLVDRQAPDVVALPPKLLAAQQAAVGTTRTLTLRFLSPLRTLRPRPLRQGRSTLFDEQCFPVEVLVQRLADRLRTDFGHDFGFSRDEEAASITADDIELDEPLPLSRMQWIQWKHGAADDGLTQPLKTDHRSAVPLPNRRGGHRQQSDQQRDLFGVMGRLRVTIHNRSVIPVLVYGQYCGIGERTNFGFGRYVIEQPIPQGILSALDMRAERSCSLIQRAVVEQSLQETALEYGADPNAVRALASSVLHPDWQPGSTHRFLLQQNGKPRVISIPSAEERAVQKLILNLLGPVLDVFLTDSCVAYRKGFGRHTAVQMLQEAWNDGCRWALKADFHQFFDSIDHQLLQDRLQVFLQDDQTVAILMKWVKAGSPRPDTGLPTGAVISPLLANLFLEQFDAHIRADGGRLIRYADDFVILFRDPKLGEEVLRRAQEEAEQLKLHLNDKKTQLSDFHTPFDFLGFRFFHQTHWQYQGDRLTQIEDLGWTESPSRIPAESKIHLPGENGLEPASRSVWIFGPAADRIRVDGHQIVCDAPADGREYRADLNRASDVVALGPPTIDRSFLQAAAATGINLFLADHLGRWKMAIVDDVPLEQPNLLLAQAQLTQQPARRLTIARELLQAKVRNYATLATAATHLPFGRQLAERLKEFATQMQSASDLEQLRGFEGAAAAAWYGQFGRFLHKPFQFESRVHPNAADPVNVLLNFGFTLLHRITMLALIKEGFSVSLGVLHEPGPHHAALASDVQEPFRHLIDRCVIDATRRFSVSSFHATDDANFPLRIEPATFRSFTAMLFEMLAIQCRSSVQQTERSYRHHIATLARTLHKHIVNPEAELRIFRH